MKFPSDEDGQVLKMLYNRGVNFEEPQNVELFVAVPNEESGISVKKTLENEGFSCELAQDEDSNEWTCYCYVSMILLYDDIIDIQKRLELIAQPYGGYSDGWAVMVEPIE